MKVEPLSLPNKKGVRSCSFVEWNEKLSGELLQMSIRLSITGNYVRTMKGKTKRIWLSGISSCLIVFGFLIRISAGIYLMSYEDNLTPEDERPWTLESMDKGEWVIYIIGAYVTPLMMLSGFLIGIWLVWQLLKNNSSGKPRSDPEGDE